MANQKPRALNSHYPRTQLQFDARSRFPDEDSHILEQFFHSSCANLLLGGWQQHSATCPKFSVEPEMGLKTFGSPSSLTGPVLISPFLHSQSEMEGFFLYYLGIFWAQRLLHELMKHRKSNLLLLSPIQLPQQGLGSCSWPDSPARAYKYKGEPSGIIS